MAEKPGEAMRSSISVTYEIDDLDRAAEELVSGVDGTLLSFRNVCGILFCFSDMDHAALLEKLAARFPHPVIGCTCIANMDQREGFHEMAVTFTVLAAEDCQFAAVSSGAVNPGNVTEEVSGTYARARAMLDGEPGLIIALPPYNLNIMLDAFTNALNAVAPNVPVLGGLPSYNGPGDRNLTIFGSRASEDSLVMLVIAGNIKPVFAIQNVSGSPVERKRKVTRARDNVVYEVGGATFVDYLREVGIPVEKLVGGNSTITSVSNPLLLENVRVHGQTNYSFVRTLHKIDLEDGSGTAIGEIPLDATLSICSLQSEHIQQAALEGMDDLTGKMRETPGYAYTTLLAISCIGRYLLMVPNSGDEVKNLQTKLPAGMTLSGFYSYGEIGPIPGAQGGLVNFAHNESLVLCAF